ncbi:MAG: helix-turn-helix domain-containing protein [Mangrovibacterium sp.]
MTEIKNDQLQLASDFVRFTNQNIFLTGKAGTGKTTFLKNLKRESPKRMVVVAPTGVAAINAGGVTIHSFFQVSFGPQVPQENPAMSVSSPTGLNAPTNIKRYSQEKINIIRSLDLLVIDEISMVRADLLDAIDEVLRRFRDRRKPFGGVQLLMIGDLQQLAPVVKEDEWNILKSYYDTCYFFSSRALRQSNFISIELRHIYRQSDEKFINLLNQIRENNIDANTLTELNKRYIPNFKPTDEEGYITLTTHNYQAQQINQTKLKELKTKEHFFEANVHLDFPEYLYPTDFELVLKTGAQVMFVKNDSSPEKRYFNGKIGKITHIFEDTIEVSCKGDFEPITVERETWQNAKYSLDPETKEIKEEVIGTFEQFPLKLAWAITIHKSQGLTFEKAIINARLSFAHGQVYVALSRCKSLEGMVLSSPIEPQSIKNDGTVRSFTQQVEENQPGEKELSGSRKIYQQQLLSELFDFKPILWQLQYLQKLCTEHGALLLGNLPQTLQQVLPDMKADMLEVSEKFDRQIRQLISLTADAEANDQLQERVTKASAYFLEKLESLVIQPLQKTGFQTDNAAIRKSFHEGMEKLHRELAIKKSVLSCCLNGFQLKTYLETKAKASISPGFRPQTTDHALAASSSHPDFFNTINTWRLKQSKAQRVPVAKIIPQNTLAEIAEKLPPTLIQLKAIKGMGGKKMQQYGREILEMAIAYRKEKGLELPKHAEKEPAKALLDSKHISFNLFVSGKTVDEIAKEREMALSTIEGHLAHFVGSGELEIKRLVSSEKQKTIAELVSKNPSLSFGELKAALGESYSYSEIRFVMKYLEATNQSAK